MLSFKDKKVLIISPHPDDEVIGCGGLISKIKKDGGKVYVLFLTNGDAADFSKAGKSTIRQRNHEIEKVAKFLKYDDYEIAFEGNSYHLMLDKLPQLELISMIERNSRLALEKIKPALVLLPHPESYNQDHRAAETATFSACRPASPNNKFQPKTILSYEFPGDYWSLRISALFNFFVELTKGHLENKLNALKLYKSQVRRHPNPRSFDALHSLATLRGAQSGCSLAEAFQLFRILS